MLVLPLVLGAVLCASQANAGAVFAHFMVCHLTTPVLIPKVV